MKKRLGSTETGSWGSASEKKAHRASVVTEFQPQNPQRRAAKHHSLDSELVLADLVPCKESLCIVQGVTCLLPRPAPGHNVQA